MWGPTCTRILRIKALIGLVFLLALYVAFFIILWADVIHEPYYDEWTITIIAVLLVTVLIALVGTAISPRQPLFLAPFLIGHSVLVVGLLICLIVGLASERDFYDFYSEQSRTLFLIAAFLFLIVIICITSSVKMYTASLFGSTKSAVPQRENDGTVTDGYLQAQCIHFT